MESMNIAANLAVQPEMWFGAAAVDLDLQVSLELLQDGPATGQDVHHVRQVGVIPALGGRLYNHDKEGRRSVVRRGDLKLLEP
jgi:hypothetical protein